MTFLAPLGLLGLLAVPAIVLLYFLKVRRPQVEVSSLMFWRPFVADRQADTPWQRLRPSLLLLLQLLAAIALGLALARPSLPGAAGVAATTAVVIDGSASMRATDARPSRFAAAVGKARDLAGQLRPGSEMAVIVAGPHAELLSPATGDATAIGSALDRASPSTGAGNLDEALSLAGGVLAGRPGASVIVIGDGHAVSAGDVRAPAPVTFIPVGAAAADVAVDGLSRAPDGEVFIRLAGYGPRDQAVQLRLLADGRQVDVLPATVPANGTADLAWNGLPAHAGVLEATVAGGDAFGLDDSAWLPVGPSAVRKVLLVTAQNGFLARALTLRPDVKLTVQKPADYERAGQAASAGDFDLRVFDGYVPKGALPAPALVVAPPEGLGPVPAGKGVDPGAIVPPAPGDPLLAGVDLREVHVQVAALTAPPPDWRTVIAGSQAPLLLVHQGEPRIAELTFDIHHSDLPLRAAFPILVRNLLEELLPGGYAGRQFQAGEAVALPADAGAHGLAVTTPDGRVVKLSGAAPVFAETDVPGVYRVREQLAAGSRESVFAVNFRDPALSRIRPAGMPAVAVAAPAGSGAAPRGALELWQWLALAGILLLLGEWVVYHRGSLRWA